MHTTRSAAAQTLTTLSQQLRATELQQAAQSQAREAQAMSPPQLEGIKEGFGAAQKIVMARLQEAIASCNLPQAEAALRDALTYSARIQGVDQAQTSITACA